MNDLFEIIELRPGWFVRKPRWMSELEFARHRFDPVTLILLGTGAMAAGQLQAGRAAEAEGRSAQNIANFNAAVMEREAIAVRRKAAFAQKRQAERGVRIKSALTARIAAAGGIGSPVAADLAAEQAAELELENLLIGFEGEVEAQRALSQAEIDRLSGKVARRRGRAAKRASRIGAGATLLTGFGEAFTPTRYTFER